MELQGVSPQTRPPAAATLFPPRLPDIVALQDAGTDISLPGYALVPSDITPNPRVTTYVQNSVPYTCDLLNSQVAHTFIELIPSTHRSRPLFILNCYLLPKQPVSELIALIKAASTAAKKDPLIILGDFNCTHVDWGYIRTKKRGGIIQHPSDAGPIHIQ